MFEALQQAARKLRRDRSLSFRQLVDKAGRYAAGLALAKWHLRGVNVVGRGVRTVKQPRIENFGHMRIGAYTLLRSVNVPVELACGPGARRCSAPTGRHGHGPGPGR